jgi:hypothetical protein
MGHQPLVRVRLRWIVVGQQEHFRYVSVQYASMQHVFCNDRDKQDLAIGSKGGAGALAGLQQLRLPRQAHIANSSTCPIHTYIHTRLALLSAILTCATVKHTEDAVLLTG